MKQSVITGSLGSLGDRFILEGYKDDIPFPEKVRQLATIEGLTGVEVSNCGIEGDGKMVRSVLSDNGLDCSCVNINIACRRIYGWGALSNKDKAIRSQAIDECMRATDYAQELGADVVNLWPGQDGFDYSLCCDYSRLYDDFLEGVVRIADHNPTIKVALEFKPREPRNRSLVESAGTALLMAAESGRANVGVCVDVGHVLYANGNMASAVEMCGKRGKLFHMHTNDCLGAWDDDMIAGSVHFIEYLELCYVLRKIKYEGWCSVDIFPSRENAVESARESIAYMSLFDKLVDRIGIAQIEECIRRGDAAYVSRVVREKVFGQ